MKLCAVIPSKHEDRPVIAEAAFPIIEQGWAGTGTGFGLAHLDPLTIPQPDHSKPSSLLLDPNSDGELNRLISSNPVY